MTQIASIGAATPRPAPSSDPMVAPTQRQSALERLLAEPGPLDRFAAQDATPSVADADHGAAPLR